MLLQLVQRVRGGFRILQQGVFGQLDFQPVGRKTFLAQDREDVVGEVGVVELGRRNVDRQEEVLRPVAGMMAGLAQDLVAHRGDQAAVLGDGDELLGRQHAALGMIPARQALEADNGVVLEVHQRLIVGLDLAAHDGRAQVLLQGRAAPQLGVHVGLEEPEVGAALLLGAVQGDV